MTKKQEKAKELYSQIADKEKISEDLLYNAICYFEIAPEEVIRMLSELEVETCKRLDETLLYARKSVREMLKTILDSNDYSDEFHDPEIEDILFYQISHGHDIS